MAAPMFAPLSQDEMRAAEREAPKARVKTPIVPVPDDAPPMAFNHPAHGKPSKTWPYHDAEGRLVGYLCRWDFPDDQGAPQKDVRPVTFCDLGDGKRGWRSKGIPAPRPLFGLPELLARGDAPVMIVEGEKTRDAAAILFPDMVVTTPAHGAKSPHLTDFAPLAGRVVVIAPDNDEPGQQFGDKVCELSRAAGAVSILTLHPNRLGASVWRDGEELRREGPIPTGFDLADALAEGWTAEAVATLHDDPTFLAPYRDAEERETQRRVDAGEPEELTRWPFRIVKTGVEKRIERVDRETGAVTVEWKWFCSALEILAETRSAEGEEWGRLLRIVDRDRKAKDWAMPMSMLAGDGVAYRERLLSLGLILAPGKFARDALHDYITTARPETKARCVSRVGWHGRTFVLSNETVERIDA